MSNQFPQTNYFGDGEQEATTEELSNMAYSAISVLVLIATLLLSIALFFFS